MALTTIRPDAPSYRAALGLPAFRRLWVAQLAAGLGEAVAQVALPLFVYALTQSTSLLGLVFVLSLLPKVILAPISGLLADRVNRRTLILAADIGRFAVVVFLPFATTTWQVAIIAVIIAIGSALARPSENAAVPMVVPRYLLVTAISLTQVSQAAVRVVGPAAGAAIVGLVGPAPAFWLQAGCFIVSIIAIFRLRLPSVEAAEAASGDGLGALLHDARREAATGLKIIWNDRVIRGLTGAEIIWQAAGTILIVGMVEYTQETLQLGARAGTIYGLLTATFGAGTVVGALIAPRIEQRVGRRTLVGVGYLGPLLLIPAGFVPPLWLLFSTWFVFGLADAWLVIAMQSHFAETVPDRFRGRFYASFGAVIIAATAFWYGMLGIVVPLLGPPTTVLLVGLVAGIGCSIVLWWTGALKALVLSGK